MTPPLSERDLPPDPTTEAPGTPQAPSGHSAEQAVLSTHILSVSATLVGVCLKAAPTPFRPEEALFETLLLVMVGLISLS